MSPGATRKISDLLRGPQRQRGVRVQRKTSHLLIILELCAFFPSEWLVQYVKTFSVSIP